MDTISSEGHVGEGCGAVVKSNIYKLAWPSDTSLQLQPRKDNENQPKTTRVGTQVSVKMIQQ